MAYMNSKFIAAALLTAALGFASAAHAASGYDVTVNAPVVQGTFHLGSHVDAASGNHALAKSRIGSISKTGSIDAEVVQTTTVLGYTGTIAEGDNARATLAIGSIHNVKIKEKLTQTTVATNAFAIAGANAEACTGIGVIGELPDCTDD